MSKFTFLVLLTLATAPLSGREWRNTAGTSKFEGTFVSHDGENVTLRKEGKILTFSIDKLHADDQAWLTANHPLKEAAGGPRVIPKDAVFDSLAFGDSREVVLEKLKASPVVDDSVAEVMLARVGLNGAYRTKEKIGGRHCHLYFDWDDKNRLKEVTLRTEPQPADSYGSALKRNWTGMIELLTTLHGAPINAAAYPNSDGLKDGTILNSHLWRNEAGHSVLLGIGQEGKQYCVNVRITTERIAPVMTNK